MSRPWHKTLHVAIRIAVVAALSAIAGVGVWIAGFDTLWAVATVLATGAVGVALAGLKFEELALWDPPGRETPRGIRLVLPMMEQSLAACDRLARPPVTRPLRMLLTNEREDRLARGRIVRQIRAVLVAELRARGITAANHSDETVIALLGRDALTVLEPTDSNPVTSEIIASCLDAVERLSIEPISAQ